MTPQGHRRFLPFVLGPHTACRSIPSLLLLALIVMGLPALAGAQQTCRPDGDVDQSGSVTAADALLAFQQALSLVQLSACQQSIADVYPQPNTPDGTITASDALCIFQKALGSPSCLDALPPDNQPPIADAGPDQSVDAGMMVILSGAASRDPRRRHPQLPVAAGRQNNGSACRYRQCHRHVHRPRRINGRDADLRAYSYRQRRRDRH